MIGTMQKLGELPDVFCLSIQWVTSSQLRTISPQDGCDFVKSRVRRWTIAGWWCMASLNTWVSPAVALVLIGTKMFRWFMFTVFGKKVILKIFILAKQGTLDRSSVPCCQSGCWPWPEHQRVTLLFSYWYIWPSGLKRDKFLSILLPYSPTRPCTLFSGIGGVAFSSLGRSSGSLCKHQIAKNVSTQDQMNANWSPAIVTQLAGQNFSCCKPSHRQFALRWENLTQGTLHVSFIQFLFQSTLQPTWLLSLHCIFWSLVCFRSMRKSCGQMVCLLLTIVDAIVFYPE